PLTVAAPGVLANDTDAEGDPLRAVLWVQPSHGTVALNPDGSFTYTPAAYYRGGVQFLYRAHDGTADGAVTPVVVVTTGPNDPPAAVDDAYTVAEDTWIQSPISVLANDADPDGQTLRAILVSGPSRGTLTL